ncbi:MAG: flagellar basal body P-ring formation chaperone FlgA [Desulforegulaceae bacterium]|nr:flagellar basal body P-ring formation chaperone FlgA [Desulforegulaceae bacterium]
MRILFLALCFIFTFNFKAYSMVLTIPEKVSVESGEKIRLDQIAKIDGKSKSIGDIIVHDEISPGKTSFLYKTQIESLLNEFGVFSVDLYMKSRVELKGSFYVLDEDHGAKLIDSHLNKLRPGEKFEIKKLILVGNRKFSSSDFDLSEVSFNSDLIKPGNNRGEIFVFSNGKETRIKFMVSLSKEVEIVCASKNLSRGKSIDFNDLELKTFSLEMEKGDYFLEKRFLLGKQLRKNYKKGEIITSAMIFRPSLINRGDEIQIAAVSDGIVVITRGQALKAGHLGDKIMVKNLKSGKKLIGEIISSTSVKVSF